MCTRSITAILSAIMLISFPVLISGRNGNVSAGGLFSPRFSGAEATVFLKDGSFRNYSIAIDYSDMLDGNVVYPGGRFAFHYGLPIYNAKCKDIPFFIYAGPGITAGYMHDRNDLDYGIFSGVSGTVGIRFEMWHDISLSVEWQADLALRFGMNTNVSFLKTGLSFSYLPILKVHYDF